MEKGKRQILYLLGSGLACLYIWATLDFPLFFHNRARPFLLDTDFIAPFLRYVAGPMDYLASLVIQLYYYPWMGALAIFSILVAIYAATAAILSAFGRSSRLVSLLPAALGLLLLQQHITIFPLLSFAFSLGMAAAFIRTNALPPAVRLAIFAALSVLTCYIAGGTALLFALVCALNALFIQKQRILAASYLVLGALIPYALGTALFQPDRTLQYFAAAPLEESSPDLHPLEIVWYALLPVAILGTAYAKALRTKRLRALQLSCILVLAVICLVMVRSRFFDFNPKTLHFYAENAEWQKALDYAQRSPAEATIMTAHIVNHSLYHTGRLPHDMFDYPQFRYGQVLLLQDDKLDSFTRVANRRSDVFYYLGRIDQAERWAHEVLTTQGFLGHALSRLVSIHVLKDQPKAARAYAGMMQKTLTHHSQGTNLIAQFEKGELLAADPEINALRPLLPKADHVGTWTSQDILTQQLLDAPTNQMAFEFLMAYLLIKGDIIGFGEKVSMIERFGYQELPRAYEEACVCYTLVAKQPPPNLNLKVRDETTMRFARFLEIYKRYESNQREAWEVLKPEFGNTYWFFDLFRRSGSLPPPDFEGKS